MYRADEELPPWYQRSDEPDEAYASFLEYLQIGPGRSVHRWFNDHSRTVFPVPPAGHYYDRAKRFQWKDRALAWDREVHESQLADLMAQHVEAKRLRISLLVSFGEKLKLAEDCLLDEDIEWRTYVPALKAFTSELRAEFDDEPRQRREISGVDGGAIHVETETADAKLRARLEALHQTANDESDT